MREYTNLQPVKVCDVETLNSIYKLRADVWITEGISSETFSDGVWKDEHEDHALHWAILDNGDLLAAARMCVHHKLNEVPNGQLFENLQFDFIPPFASINRLVIRPEARRLGLSKKLDFVRIQTALHLGCRTVVAYCVQASGVTRVKSLERNGFQIIDSSQSLILNPYGFVTSLALSLQN